MARCLEYSISTTYLLRNGAISFVSFSAEGSLLAVASDNRVFVLDLGARKASSVFLDDLADDSDPSVFSLQGHSIVSALIWLDDSTWMCGFSDGVVAMVQTLDYNKVCAHPRSINSHLIKHSQSSTRVRYKILTSLNQAIVGLALNSTKRLLAITLETGVHILEGHERKADWLWAHSMKIPFTHPSTIMSVTWSTQNQPDDTIYVVRRDLPILSV